MSAFVVGQLDMFTCKLVFNLKLQRQHYLSTSPLLKQLFHLQVSSNLLRVENSPIVSNFFKKLLQLLSGEGWGSSVMTLTMRENFSLLLSMGPPLGGYAEIICFRSSCRRGRISSFSPPGFVREDE